MWTFAGFNEKKIRIYRNLMMCQHGQGREVEAVRTFCGQGDQCVAILCGRHLWTPLKIGKERKKLTQTLVKDNNTNLKKKREKHLKTLSIPQIEKLIHMF